MKNERFCHLHVHDEYSALDAFGSPERYAERAAEMGFQYLGISNHGNIDSAIKLQSACASNGISPIIGCELYIDKDMLVKDKSVQMKHLCVFVKDEVGWKNLLQLLTIANLEGFYRKPRIDPETLLKHSEGLVITTACTSSFIVEAWGLKLLERLVKKQPEDVYLEIQPHSYEEQIKHNKKCISLSRKLGIKIIATNDCHYIDAQDAILQEILLAVNSRSTWEDPKRWRFSIDTLYLCSAKKMQSLFKKNHPYISNKLVRESMGNTIDIAEKCCDFKIDRRASSLPLIPGVEKENEIKFFKQLVRKGLKRRTKQLPLDQVKIYQERIDEEMQLLIEKGFIRYFLIVWEIVNWCSENEISVGPGRGSAAGSLISYCLGITQVDPIQFNLLFFRFLSPSRKDLPDIDVDFDRFRRDEVIQHIKDVYGENNVIQITTFLTMKGKMALQDVGRVFGAERSAMSNITKKIDDDGDLKLEDFTESEDPDLQDFYAKSPAIVDYALRLQNTVRGYGCHAAGVCISNEILTNGDKCNLCLRGKNVVGNWAKEDSEYMGLMKLDILGLSALSRMKACLDAIEENHGKKINLRELEYTDKNVFKDLSDGYTTGVFQLKTYGITKYCKELEINSFEDIYNATALFRPGTLRSGMAAEFIKRKHGKHWKAIHKNVQALTKDTHGIIVYQEQVMLMARELAGFDWDKCERLRKVIAKSQGEKEFDKFKSDFINGCVDNKTLDKESAIKLFEDLVSFSRYSFNLSHAVSYSVMSYRDAWLKHYYPLEYFAALLTYEEDKKEMGRILDELVRERGIGIKLPKTAHSHPTKWRAKDGYLLMPFTEIIGIGEAQAELIVGEAKKKRASFFTSSSNQDLPAKVKQILSDLKANEPEYMLTYNEAKRIKGLFQYNVIKLLDS